MSANKKEEATPVGISYVVPDLTNGAKLYQSDPMGQNKTFLGYVCATPQRCAIRSPGSSLRATGVYVTNEAISELIFVDKGSFTKQPDGSYLYDRTTLSSAAGIIPPLRRQSGDATAKGCGYVSKGVVVTNIVDPTSTKHYQEVPYATAVPLYYAIAAVGSWLPQVGYYTSEFWISEQEWVPDSAQASDALKNAYTNIRATYAQYPIPSPCPDWHPPAL